MRSTSLSPPFVRAGLVLASLCWGSGGLLGDGTFTRRLTPAPVLGPS